eukprot:CAMPEP_0184506172 /NCGR_PEP_ID=MMETSP0113_2-20130426/53362_1 /TAXON_ID=91329 /ORGANISM="Norrisiella sphaerica, Strain BC52" /LENGTH=66 /DNA_ID=CAMNT_0026895877 /DNA_START=660 /DNA_END=860 /DNA_ORIENTATION=+
MREREAATRGYVERVTLTGGSTELREIAAKAQRVTIAAKVALRERLQLDLRAGAERMISVSIDNEA